MAQYSELLSELFFLSSLWLFLCLLLLWCVPAIVEGSSVGEEVFEREGLFVRIVDFEELPNHVAGHFGLEVHILVLPGVESDQPSMSLLELWNLFIHVLITG